MSYLYSDPPEFLPIPEPSKPYQGRKNVPRGTTDDVALDDLPEFEPFEGALLPRGPLDQDGMPYFIEHVYVSVWKKKLSEKRNKRYGSTLQH